MKAIPSLPSSTTIPQPQLARVRYHQEEYVEKKGISEVPKPNSSRLPENYPKQPKETSRAAISHLQDSQNIIIQEFEHAVLRRKREEKEQQLLREMKEIEEEEAALAEMTKLIGAIIPQRGLTFRRARGSRRSRNTRPEEENAMFAFFNDDTPAQVGEVRYYQEEYEEKKEISELQELNLSKLQESQPKQPEETSSAATSHLQGEPSTVNYKTENETSAKEEAKAQIKASNEVDVTFEVLGHVVARGEAKFRGNREARMNIRFGPL